jgi:hypothetical protein
MCNNLIIYAFISVRRGKEGNREGRKEGRKEGRREKWEGRRKKEMED